MELDLKNGDFEVDEGLDIWSDFFNDFLGFLFF